MQDWFSQFEQTKPKSDPWFDQFGSKTEDTKPPEKSLLDKAKEVGKRFLFGPSDEDLNSSASEKDKALGPIHIASDSSGATNLLSRGTSKLANIIDDPNSANRSTSKAFAAGALQGVGNIVGDAFDPRTASIKPVPRIDPQAVQSGLDATANAYKDISQFQPAGPKLLPAMGESSPPSSNSVPNFYNGPAGTAQANRTYPLDTGPINPKIGAPNQGTVLPRELGEITQLPAIDAANRGTTLGQIQKSDLESPKGLVKSMKSFQQGNPLEVPKTGIGSDLARDYTPNPAKMDPRLESPLPKPDARSFGGPREIGDINEGTSKPDALSATEAPKDSTNPQGEPKGTAISKVTDKTALPEPGSARPSKDVNPIRAELGSVDKTLESRPETKPIVDAIVTANDQKLSWIATTERELAKFTAGLKPDKLNALGRMLDKGIIEGVDDPELIQRANGIREVLDQIHSELPEKLPYDKSLGYIENYLTHIEKQDPDLRDGMRQVWDFHTGKGKSFMKDPLGSIKRAFQSPELSGTSDSVGDMYQTGMGNPNSNYVKTRTGKLEDYELNANKVLPAYVESIAKLKFDKPAVEQAKLAMSKLGDIIADGSESRIKDLAKWYITNYTKYDALPGLSKSWNSFADTVGRVTSRSMLGFNTGLQTLHLARIPANLFPNLPTKYLAAGLKEVGSAPINSYKEAVNLGLLQSEIRPIQFKTATQKMDSILQLGSVADYLDRAIGYHGFKKMYLDQGMKDIDATAAALRSSKRASLVTDAARPIKAFNPESGFVGSIAKLSMQFKQVPLKIIEQYAGIADNAKSNPAAAARMVSGVGLAIAAAEEGLRTFHISPKSFLVDLGGASGTEVKKIVSYLAKGDLENAVKETALWVTPGGLSVMRQLNNGPSFIEQNNAPVKKPSLNTPRLKMPTP